MLLSVYITAAINAEIEVAHEKKISYVFNSVNQDFQVSQKKIKFCHKAARSF